MYKGHEHKRIRNPLVPAMIARRPNRFVRNRRKEGKEKWRREDD